MFVKICGITRSDDALLAVALGADALGFVFAPSSRMIAVDRARDIARRLPPEVLTVGVFRDSLPDRVVEVVTRAGLGAAQLHGRETAEQTRAVRSRLATVIKAFPAGAPGLASLSAYGADVVLIDSAAPGSGEVFDWSLAEDAPLAGHKVLLAGGLRPDNVAEAIVKVRPWGVDVSSGVEARPGVKDPLRLRHFIEAAKSAEDSDEADAVSPDAVVLPSRHAPYDWEEDPRS